MKILIWSHPVLCTLKSSVSQFLWSMFQNFFVIAFKQYQLCKNYIVIQWCDEKQILFLLSLGVFTNCNIKKKIYFEDKYFKNFG